MTSTQIQRYQPGGDLFATLQDRYGHNIAQRAAQLAADDDPEELQRLLSDARPGGYNIGDPLLNDSTLGNFVDQLTTDPLAAPLDSLNEQLKKAVQNVVGNPFVLAAVVFGLLVLLAWLGGLSGVRRRLA